MKTDTPSWGIEPVPERLRVLGTVDTALLWGNLGVSLLVLVAAAFLVPALSLPQALVAIVVGALIGNLMLAAAGGIGAEARVPAMVLMRAPLGRRGSYLPTALNVAQCLGWADLRADHHRRGGRGPLGRALRLRGPRRLDAPVRRRSRASWR